MNNSCRRKCADPKRRELYPKDVNGWFKALDIARVLFNEEGYHNAFINQIDDFIRKEKIMYSPKIQPELIPVLYHQAKAKRLTMTKLVDRIIRGYLEATKQEHALSTTLRRHLS